MKKFIVLFILSLIPIFGYSQSISKDKDSKEDVVITINLSKAGKAVSTVAEAVKDEVDLYKKEIDENLSPERKAEIKQKKENIKSFIKNSLKEIHDEAHRGFRQGLRGERYDPNRD